MAPMRSACSFLMLVAAFLATGWFAPARLDAQTPQYDKALLIPIDVPLRGQADEIAKQRLSQAVSRFPKEGDVRPILVLEFRTKEGETGEGASFERCLSLARFLVSGELRRAKVVAYVPRPLKGHSVLPVLACEQVILSPEASLGDAGIDESTISPTLVGSYREIAEARRTFPAAVAIGMLDNSTTVSRVETSDGVQYVLADELKEIQAREAVTAVTTVLDGESRTLDAEPLRLKYGFVSHLASGRAEVAAALGLRPEDLQEDPSLVRPWKAARVRLHGPITVRSARWVRDQMEIAIQKQEVNFICLEIDSAGGDLTAALLLADYLAGLDPSTIRTVAYVAKEARSDAALVALACDQVMMTPDSLLGGEGATAYDAQQISDAKASIKEMAHRKGRDWSLPLAMVDQSLELASYTSGDGSQPRYWTEEELAQQSDPNAWTRGEAVRLNAGLKPEEAVRLGAARGIAGTVAQIEEEYHLTEPMPLIDAGWAHELVQRLADPRLAGVLLFVAFFALILEAMSPGIGLPSLVSGVCFMLFFWSQFLNGTAGWLEVLLFVTGAACIAVELFFIPGFGVFGLSGILMVVASIVLASQTFIIPTNAYQLRQLPTSLYMVTGALGGTMACLLLMRKYLPNAPIMRRMMLAKEAPDELERRRQREALASYDYLLHKRGTVVTPLTPSGKARFGDELVDVVSADGDYVERNSDIYVVEVLGNRVAVRRIA